MRDDAVTKSIFKGLGVEILWWRTPGWLSGNYAIQIGWSWFGGGTLIINSRIWTTRLHIFSRILKKARQNKVLEESL